MILVYLAVIVASTWGALALAGLPVLLHLDDRRQRLVLPALPVIGAMAFVVLVHWPAAVLPSPISLALASAALGVIALIGWRRGGRLRPRRADVGVLALALALGVVPAVLALLPVLEQDRPRLVQPTLNNDAFAYVSVSAWLRDEPALDVPRPVEDPPVYGYVTRHLDIGLRVGEEFLHVGASLINGRDVASTWYSVLAVWVLMIPGSIWAACRLTRVGAAVGPVAGFVAGSSAVLLSQVYNQNSAAVLGVCMAPIAIITLLHRLDGDDLLPHWCAPLALAALAGTYTEYLPVLAPGVVAFALLRAPRHLPATVLRGLTIAVAGLVASPLIWWNVFRSLVLTTGVTAPGVESSFIHAPGAAIRDRVVGATFLDGVTDSPLGVWLVGVVAVGVVGAVATPRLRRTWLPIAVGAVAVILFLTFVHRFPYGQQRAVQITVPLVLVLATGGFGQIVGRLAVVGRGAATATGRLLAVPVLAVGASFPVANVASSLAWEKQFHVAARTVDASLLEGAGWVQDLDQREGADTMVVSSNFFEQLWLTYELRDEERVSWPFLYPDYMNVGRYDRWDGELRRFALVGRDDHVDADPGVVVRENARFRLLDLTRGDALIASPTANWGGGERRPDGVSHWMGDNGEVLIVRTADAPEVVTFEGVAMADLAPLPIDVTDARGEVLTSAAVAAVPTRFSVTVPDAPGVLLSLRNGRPAAVPSSGEDPRALSLYLTAVRRG